MIALAILAMILGYGFGIGVQLARREPMFADQRFWPQWIDFVILAIGTAGLLEVLRLGTPA